jgi:hypothetical protein
MSHEDELEEGTEQVGKTGYSQKPPKDPLLAVLVKYVDKTPGWEFGLTLHVNGVIVSGMLCAMTSFFEEQANLIREYAPPENGEGQREFAKSFDYLAEESRPGSSDDQVSDRDVAESEGNEDPLPGFIHLRAATVHAPGTDAVLPEMLWRGRLDHVSGWSIGNFGPKPPPRSR